MNTTGYFTSVPNSINAGYVCAGCSQYVYYAWGVHTCPGKPLQFFTYAPPTVDLSEVLRELREIKEIVRRIRED